MPGLTLDTSAVPSRSDASQPATQPRTSSNGPAAEGQPSRSSSPPRPPISPITPTLSPKQLPSNPSRASLNTTGSASTTTAPPSFGAGRPSFSHTTQADQTAAPIAPPPPAPIDFDSNPDVLALKSAISILQLQRARATADITSLSRAKEAALAQPDAFLHDLSTGQVRTDGDRLFVTAQDEEDDDDDDDDDEDEDDDEDNGPASGGSTEQPSSNSGLQPSPMKPSGAKTKKAPKPAWHTLPKPQNVVRCPPVNWSQYAVVGDSLDKLHNEQLTRPTQGQPAVLGANGTYEFKGEGAANPADGRRLVGVAAPYTPGRDRIEKKPKGAKR